MIMQVATNAINVNFSEIFEELSSLVAGTNFSGSHRLANIHRLIKVLFRNDAPNVVTWHIVFLGLFPI